MKDRIRKIRKELDFTQQEFANKIGTTANVLTNYETGRRNPSASVINNICKTFNVNETWLRTGEGNMFIVLPENASLDDFAKNHNATETDYQFIRNYLSLDPTVRSQILSLFPCKPKE